MDSPNPKPRSTFDPPSRIADLLRVDRAPLGTWRPEEFGQILAHQLAAPLVFDLGQLSPEQRDGPGDRTVGGGPGLASFADVLAHPAPPVGLLRAIKEYAKVSDREPAPALPGAVAMVLYYSAVVVAQLRCGVRISELGDRALARAAQTMLSQDWIDPGTKKLFREALERLPPEEPGAET